MKEVRIKDSNDREHLYQIPSGWDEVSLGTFQKFLVEQKAIKNGMPVNITQTVKLMSAITGIETKLLFKMTTDQFNLLNEELTFIQNEIDEAPADEIVLEGETYYIKKDFDKLSMGEVASIEILTEKYDGEISVALPELLTIFLRKKTENGKLEEYDVELMEERSEIFKQVPISKVYKLMSFFLTGKDLSGINMKDSLENQTNKKENEK